MGSSPSGALGGYREAQATPEAGEDPAPEGRTEVPPAIPLAVRLVSALSLGPTFPAAAAVTRDAGSGWVSGDWWGRRPRTRRALRRQDPTPPCAAAVGLGRLQSQGAPPGGRGAHGDPGERFSPRRLRTPPPRRPTAPSSDGRPAALLPESPPHRCPRGPRGCQRRRRLSLRLSQLPSDGCGTTSFQN
ncbi:serine/arginine repetitive matrix protein 3-like [Panthera uncia]|uniref:serine/arginine repetitive matrix protein 3-like n=1 Tax=Panthera uncia TaxID=29064 RepID=UPI0020FFA835|nr:serine/arginine repetitive matrix protein 3-like [Panthera uncia]